jgi:hypothetical protein
MRQAVYLHLHRRGNAQGCTDDEKTGLSEMQSETSHFLQKVIFMEIPMYIKKQYS